MTPAETNEVLRLQAELNRTERRRAILAAALQRLESRFASVNHHDGEALGIASTALMQDARIAKGSG